MNIGFLSCHESEYFPQFQTFAFESEQSLLDFDLVLWHLEFLHFGYELSFGHQCQDLQRLLDDRERRLEEIERFLTQGKSLVILLSDPVTILGDLREYLQGLIGSLDYNDLTQELMHRAVEVNERVQVTLNQVFGEARGPEHTFDIYSFLLEHVEELLRKHAVPVKKRSNEIDFHGDSAFLGFWESIKGVAWYDVFFSAPNRNAAAIQSRHSVSSCCLAQTQQWEHFPYPKHGV
jgi:hypothetical protein